MQSAVWGQIRPRMQFSSITAGPPTHRTPSSTRITCLSSKTTLMLCHSRSIYSLEVSLHQAVFSTKLGRHDFAWKALSEKQEPALSDAAENPWAAEFIYKLDIHNHCLKLQAKGCVVRSTYVFLLNDIPLGSFLAHSEIQMLIAKGDNCFMNLKPSEICKKISWWFLLLVVVVDLVIRLFFLFPQSQIRLEINPKLRRIKEKNKKSQRRTKQTRKIHFSKTLIMENFPRNTQHRDTKKKKKKKPTPFTPPLFLPKTTSAKREGP